MEWELWLNEGWNSLNVTDNHKKYQKEAETC